MKKRILAVVLAVLTIFAFTGCSTNFLKDSQLLKDVKNPVVTFVLEYQSERHSNEERRVTFEYELQYYKAPSTVANFIQLVNKDYYKDKILNAVSTGTVSSAEVQYVGGASYSRQSGGLYKRDTLNYTIKGEFKANGWVDADNKSKNDLKHEAGSLVMNRSFGADKAFDTAFTEFYIALNDSNARQDNFAVFGVLLRSKYEFKENGVWKSLSALGNTDTDGFADGLFSEFVNDMLGVSKEYRDTTVDKSQIYVPINDVKITSMTANTFGTNFTKAKVAKTLNKLNS